MLVAEKEFETYKQTKEKNKKHKRKRRPKRSENASIKAKIFIYATLILTIALAILLRYAHISKLQYDLSTLETQVDSLEKEKQDIELTLEKVKDSGWIEKIAKNSLGMNYPSENQKVYLSVNVDDNETAQKTKEDNDKEGVLASFSNIFEGILN